MTPSQQLLEAAQALSARMISVTVDASRSIFPEPSKRSFVVRIGEREPKRFYTARAAHAYLQTAAELLP